MGILASIATLGLKDLVLGILDRIKLPPEKKAEIEKAMAEHAFELQKMEMELASKQADQVAKEIEAASANIRAEATSGDEYTRRARPTFMYLIYLILAFNYIALPLVQLFRGQALAPIDLPSDMYWLFAAGYLGYAGFRSLDKGGFKWNRNNK